MNFVYNYCSIRRVATTVYCWFDRRQLCVIFMLYLLYFNWRNSKQCPTLDVFFLLDNYLIVIF